MNTADVEFFRGLVHDLDCKYALNISLRRECEELSREKGLSLVLRARREEDAHKHYRLAEDAREVADRIRKYLMQNRVESL